jgi:hypothetical protein
MAICHQRGTAWFIREMRDEMNTLLRAMLIVVPLGLSAAVACGRFQTVGLTASGGGEAFAVIDFWTNTVQRCS